ncbi:MAG: hypothetical protein SFV18_09275 [Bryobacteraceae bacterium]|nr:hypothetical protein [Bryobacteraceae bacterium]
MTAQQLLKKVFAILTTAVERDPELARQVEELFTPPPKAAKKPRASTRNTPVLNPFEDAGEGLAAKLEALTLDQLKDIGAAYLPGQRTGSIRKKETLIERILAATQQGDVFRH